MVERWMHGQRSRGRPRRRWMDDKRWKVWDQYCSSPWRVVVSSSLASNLQQWIHRRPPVDGQALCLSSYGIYFTVTRNIPPAIDHWTGHRKREKQQKENCKNQKYKNMRNITTAMQLGLNSTQTQRNEPPI